MSDVDETLVQMLESECIEMVLSEYYHTKIGRMHVMKDAAKALEAKIDGLRGQLLHAQSCDPTASDDGEHGEQRTWDFLTDEQRTWWIAAAQEEGKENAQPQTGN